MNKMEQIKVVKDGWQYPKNEVVTISAINAKEAVDEGWAIYDNFEYIGNYDESNDEPEDDYSDYEVNIDNKHKKSIPTVTKEIFKDGNDLLKKEMEETTKKTILQLPCAGKLISKFAIETGEVLGKTKTIFYRPDSMDLVEVGIYTDNEGNECYKGFINIKPSRFITLVEKWGIPGYDLWVPATRSAEGYWDFKEKSMTSELSKTVLESHYFQEKMPNIDRIFTVPLPIIYNGILSFPKQGFDVRFNSWLPFDCPKIEDENMSLKDAKELIDKTYSEFCFKDKQDMANAVAAAITPFCRGLFSNFNVRTPPGFYKGNRPRVGKDCCAGITGIIYEGYSLSDPPISSGESSGNNNEEFRKKLLSLLIAGRRRSHSSNNKGKINNSVFEAVITEPVWSDRGLGGNKIYKFNNEIDFSLSGNTNVTLTADLEDRCLFINLFLDIENANDRVFNKPNLHEWVLNNRGKLLSAFYSLVKNWFENESKPGSIPFSSYPEWSNIVGGIMESAGYENPCKRDKNTELSINDPEKDYMKQIYEYFYKLYPNKVITRKIMIDIIKDPLVDLDVFLYLDFTQKSGQMKLSTIINSYNGRILSNIRFKIIDINIRGIRQEVIFERISKDGHLGHLGHHQPLELLEQSNNLYKKGWKVAKVTKVANNLTNIETNEQNITKWKEENGDEAVIFDENWNVLERGSEKGRTWGGGEIPNVMFKCSKCKELCESYKELKINHICKELNKMEKIQTNDTKM